MNKKNKMFLKLESSANSITLFNLLWILILAINKPYLDTILGSQMTNYLDSGLVFVFFITSVIFVVSKQKEYLNEKLYSLNIVLFVLLILQFIFKN